MWGKLQRIGWLLLIAILLIFGSTRSIAARIEPGAHPASAIYILHGIDRVEDRSAVAATGVDIIEVGTDYIVIDATPGQIDRIRQLGFAPSRIQSLAPVIYPNVDPAYHTYAQMVADIQAYAITYTNIMKLITVGVSYEGKPIWAAKISDNPNIDAGEPEVLFTFHQHAREHLTVEQGLYTLHLLTDNYSTNVTITQLVNTRVVWLFFDLNPDGGEYDITGGNYQGWRKNCQPICDSSNLGTDLNRNWGYNWGYDNSGSSPVPSDDTYRGPSAFSAPETTVISNFVASRVISGVQRIKVAIDFHAYSELVLWPYGYAYASGPPDMQQHDYDIMQTMGTAMAQMNGYTPEQASALYLTNGTIDDWLYGTYRIYAFTFEMYPQYAFGLDGFYPPGSVIATQTERNRDPILYAITVAGNPDQVLPPLLPKAYLPLVMR